MVLEKKLSTDNAIFSLTHEILKSLSSKMVVGSIFFDLEKAFDSIDHSLLIKKTSVMWYTGQIQTSNRILFNKKIPKLSTKQPFVRFKIRFKMEEGKTWCPTGINFGPSLVYIIH